MLRAPAMPPYGTPDGPASDKIPDGKIWACLLHLSFNFAAAIQKKEKPFGEKRSAFEPEKSLWDDAIARMSEEGINMVLINLDDSVLWDSHPEIALKGSWTPVRLREEPDKIRKAGIEPVPMFNFSSTHDAWLGKYSRMLSTQQYDGVCRDLIAEAIDIFDGPRFFHLGMDEEDASHQRYFDYIAFRQHDLWWGDLYFFPRGSHEEGIPPVGLVGLRMEPPRRIF